MCGMRFVTAGGDICTSSVEYLVFLLRRDWIFWIEIYYWWVLVVRLLCSCL